MFGFNNAEKRRRISGRLFDLESRDILRLLFVSADTGTEVSAHVHK